VVLDLPDPDVTQLPGSPLELVVCEIRFETKVSVSESKTALDLHESLGGPEGLFQRVDPVQQQTLTMMVGAPPNLESRGLSGWRFSAETGGWTLSVMPEHVALETTAYTTWENFREQLHPVIAATEAVIAPGFAQRLGLRYIDRIRELQLKAPADWAPYIAPELLGFAASPNLGPALRNAQQQLLLDLDEGFFCTLRHGFVVEDDGEPTVDYLLDYDLFREGGRRFDREDLIAALDHLSAAGLQLFQASVTDDLLARFRG
jgi:uncharacterized protein (TIGR04255 family)